jgi:integrase/recombinase XerC/integrase/recombinase XerD
MSSNKANHTQQVQEVHDVQGTQDVQEVGGKMDNAVILRGRIDIVQEYIDTLDVKPKSRDTYQKALKQFMLYMDSSNISQPTRSDILAYKAYLMENYKACTVSSYMTAVKGLFAYLEAEKIFPNIANGIKGAKHQQGFRKDALTIDQARRLLNSIDTSTIEGKRNYALINLLLNTGLRTIEAERACIGDIRQEGGEALLYIQGKGRDSKDAFVVLTDSTLYPIQLYLKARSIIDPKAALFASHSDRNEGNRITTRTISWIVKEALKAIGIDSERITAHSLRHTAVTFSLLAGATIQEAQAMARHANVNTTLIYAHNIDRIAKAPERRIEKMLALGGQV